MNWSLESASIYQSSYEFNYEKFIANYASITWRNEAIIIIENTINEFNRNQKTLDEFSINIINNKLLEFLYTYEKGQGAINIIKEQHNKPDEPSIIEILIAEACANIFSSDPKEELWVYISKLINNNRIAFELLTNNIKNHISNNPNLKTKIIEIAEKFIDDFLRNPSALFTGRDKVSFDKLSKDWASSPDLDSLHLVDNYNQYFWPIRSDFFILDLIFEMDPEDACRLIEKLKNPYQINIILENGNILPNRKFENWVKLVKFAKPTFSENGIWTGALLMPLILNTCVQAIKVNNFYDAAKPEELKSHILTLSKDIASIIWQRPDAKPLSLWWTGQLFRAALLHNDPNINNPGQINSKCFIEWQIIKSIVENPDCISWLNIELKNIKPPDELCYYAAKIIAFNENDGPLIEVNPYSKLLPLQAEDFLEGETGIKMREYCSLFTGLNVRPDSFALQTLAMPLIGSNPLKNLKKLWHKTIILREIVEHDYAYSDDYINSDISSISSSIIWLIISLGINLLDFIQDKNNNIEIENINSEVIEVLKLLNEAIKEMMSICTIGRNKFEDLSNHLCVRRGLYGASRQNSTPFMCSLNENESPTLGEMLFIRCEINNSFFDCIRMLVQNKIPLGYIKRSLSNVGVEFDNIIKQVETLNEINVERKISLSDILD